MRFVASLLCALVPAVVVALLVTLLTPRLTFPRPSESTPEALRAAITLRTEALDDLGPVGWILRDIWSEDERPRDPRKALEEGTYSFVDDRWTKGRLATLDGRVEQVVAIRDRARYGVLVSALFAAMGLGLLRASGRYRSKHMTILGLAFIAGTFMAPMHSSPAASWVAMLLGLPILIFAIVGSLFGDRDGGLSPHGLRGPITSDKVQAQAHGS